LLACSQTSSDSGDQAVDLTISKPVSGPTLRVAVRFILQVSSVIARARAEQAELCQQLRAHRDRVDFEVHDLRRRFASLRIGLSHLAGLIGYRDDEIWQVLSDCLEVAGQASERLDQFLVVAESEQLGLELNLTRIDLFELVFRALDQHRRWAASRSLRLRNLVPKSLRVDADPQLMERVLTNLVENAVRYADHDGELVVDAERLARGVELVVSNTGPAVPEQVRECLFQKFVRGPDRGEATGAGLGLYFCHCVVNEHGGSIRVEQRPGWAVSVVVRLPS
jgi:signal transduction histidine kinase